MRRGPTPETRAQLAKMIGEAQESLSFHSRWLELGSPDVGPAYKALVDKVREKNSIYRQQALDAPPPTTDGDLGKFRNAFLTDSDKQDNECLIAMQNELKFSRRRHAHKSRK